MTKIGKDDLIVIVTDSERKNMRNTLQRELVYDIVMNSSDHPSADVVYERARRMMPRISMGTVYRNLKQLAEAGRIREIRISDDSNRYDKTLHTHAHFRCRVCGRVTDIETECGAAVPANGFSGKLESTDILFGGVCADCAAREEA